MSRLLMTLAAALFCTTACVSMGTNFDPAAVAQLQPGMSKAEVIARLGEPNSRSVAANGEEVLLWLHSRGTALGTARARSATLLFDANGRYVRMINVTETQMR